MIEVTSQKWQLECVEKVDRLISVLNEYGYAVLLGALINHSPEF